MATFIPSIAQLEEYLTNTAERRVAKFLDKNLGSDCIVWCNIPTGNKHRYADFLVLMPNTGLLCLEVKDWNLKTLRHVSKQNCSLELDGTNVQMPHPLEQARGYALNAVNELAKDKQLLQTAGNYAGKLILPYAYGVVFTHFSRDDVRKQIGDKLDTFDKIFPLHQTLYKNDLGITETAQSVRNRLAGMFLQRFPCTLNAAQIDRIRWHLFPEIRISSPVQQSLFDETKQPETRQLENALPNHSSAEHDIPEIKPIAQIPEIIKVMDMQQELMARMMGGGHRVIHGVAGSGKTLILGLRAQVLAERTEKPILVLCYNITLAAKLRAMIADKKLSDKVQVHHFHEWCGQLVKQHHIAHTPEEQKLPFYEQAVQAALRAAQNGDIPAEQYGAVLIDEGHDFEADWLRLAVKMLDKADNHLLLLYDDAQSIYPNQAARKGIKFSLSSVGIEARGRTVKLANNYRNTKQIIGFAHVFAQHNLHAHDSDDDTIPVVEPCAVGADGVNPHIQVCSSWQDELHYLERCLKKWQPEIAPNDLAIICPQKQQCEDVCALLQRMDLDFWALQKTDVRKKYDPKQNKIAVLPIPSSKGLEFPRVVLMGAEVLHEQRDNVDPTRLLYVGMTRAQSYLLLTLSGENAVTEQIKNSFKQWQNFQAA